MDNIDKYRGKIARFTKNDAINKDLVLLVNIEILVDGVWIPFRDHLWMNSKGFDRSKQEYIAYFFAKKYKYGITTYREGLTLKIPKLVTYSKGIKNDKRS